MLREIIIFFSALLSLLVIKDTLFYVGIQLSKSQFFLKKKEVKISMRFNCINKNTTDPPFFILTFLIFYCIGVELSIMVINLVNEICLSWRNLGAIFQSNVQRKETINKIIGPSKKGVKFEVGVDFPPRQMSRNLLRGSKSSLLRLKKRLSRSLHQFPCNFT